MQTKSETIRNNTVSQPKGSTNKGVGGKINIPDCQKGVQGWSILIYSSEIILSISYKLARVGGLFSHSRWRLDSPAHTQLLRCCLYLLHAGVFASLYIPVPSFKGIFQYLSLFLCPVFCFLFHRLRLCLSFSYYLCIFLCLSLCLSQSISPWKSIIFQCLWCQST